MPYLANFHGYFLPDRLFWTPIWQKLRIMKITNTYQPKLTKRFIGRKNEQKRIQHFLENTPSIAVVYGRRRSGKTELIEQTLSKHKLIKLEGIEDRDKQYQISSLLEQLSKGSIR